MMAEFQEVMKQRKRMCAFTGSTCNGCPFKDKDCGFNAAKDNAANYERIVMQWAEENPEPVYPTWLEWLHSQTLANFDSSSEACKLSDRYRESSKDVPGIWVLTAFARSPIPADIAQKLGLEPKEG